jgi:hypothetical protein
VRPTLACSQRVGDLLRLELQDAREGRRCARVRGIDDHAREVGRLDSCRLQRAGDRVEEDRRQHVGAKPLLPLTHEALLGQTPGVEHLGGRRCARQADGTGLVVGRSGEGDRGVAALALARATGRADHDVGRGDERALPGGCEVETQQQATEPHAGPAAELDAPQRRGQPERGLDRGGVELLRIRWARGGEDQRVGSISRAKRLARGFHGHGHRVLVVARNRALALARADRRAGYAEVGDVAAIPRDSSHWVLPVVSGTVLRNPAIGRGLMGAKTSSPEGARSYHHRKARRA